MAGKHSKTFLDTIKVISVFRILSRSSGKNKMSLPFKIVTTALVLCLVASAIWVGVFFAEGNNQKDILNEAKEHFKTLGGNKAIKILSDKNEDIKGWINIENTDISYAVCHNKDDNYYTNHNQIGEESRYGAIRLSASDTFERKGNDRNIVILGNNMKDGTMFGSLKEYRKLHFYKQNPVIELYYGKTQEKYMIFSVMLVALQGEDATNVYNPTKSHFADEDDFDAWYKESCERSLITTPVNVKYGDDMLTLITSAKDFDGARLVVMAKKVTDKEILVTNVNNAVVNSKIKYPRKWYTEQGLKYPY